MLEPARRHELEADADAEKGLAPFPYRLLQRLDHARNAGEASAAVGKGSDARQHDARRRGHLLRLGRDLDGDAVSMLARGPLERLGGGMEVARAIIDDGDVHRGSGPREQSDDFVPVPARSLSLLIER